MIAGFLLVGLAAVGVILPLLPTTPLLLLAAVCFAHSSEKCHTWLLEHRIFGPIIQHWNESRTIPLRAKIIALASIILFGTYAVGFALEDLFLRISGAAILLTGFFYVFRIPVSPGE